MRVGLGGTVRFPAHTAGLKAIEAFLHEHQVNTIAMESTGVYWLPLYELLAAEGFEVLLVDPSYSRRVVGGRLSNLDKVDDPPRGRLEQL